MKCMFGYNRVKDMLTIPYETVPSPLMSNSWNAVLYRASGVHSRPSNAWNSANEMRPSLLVSAMPASNFTESFFYSVGREHTFSV